jgi:hypothetical protein
MFAYADAGQMEALAVLFGIGVCIVFLFFFSFNLDAIKKGIDKLNKSMEKLIEILDDEEEEDDEEEDDEEEEEPPRRPPPRRR